MPTKIIRDPVHDVVALDVADPTERLLFGLLNAAEVQRLRRVRQLGMAHLAYPGADHSRYSHSLGVLVTARLMLDRLAVETTITREERGLCLVAALLHDLGHGPFSHVFERVTGVRHEQLTYRVILDPESEVHQLLIRHDATMPERVVRLLQGRHERRFLSDVVSGTLDADRLDYLVRDNLMTGSNYGGYDLRWLLAAMTVDPRTQRLVVLPKGVSAVEGYLQARYHMYRNVYFHKVVRSAEGMLRLALKRAKRLAVQDRLPWPGPADGGGVHTALLGQRMTMAEFVDLDDVSLVGCFKLWAASSGDATLARLCRGLLFRRLFKSLDVTQHADPPGAYARAVEAVRAAGGDPEYELFYDEATDTPYAIDETGARGVQVLMPDGTLTDVAELSPMTAAMNRQLGFKRLHFAEERRDAVLAAVG